MDQVIEVWFNSWHLFPFIWHLLKRLIRCLNILKLLFLLQLKTRAFNIYLQISTEKDRCRRALPHGLKCI